jgi:hypothetical protein
MTENIAPQQCAENVNELYRKVAARWGIRVTESPFRQHSRAGTLLGILPLVGN